MDRTCEQATEKAYLEAKEINMLGDFNFNLLRENTETRHWLHTTDSFNFTLLVTKPTRVNKENSETLTDHV